MWLSGFDRTRSAPRNLALDRALARSYHEECVRCRRNWA